MKHIWDINIKGVGTLHGVIAETKWEAKERAYSQYQDKQPDRTNYKPKKRR